MIQYDSRCSVCKLIQGGDEKLMNRLYASRAYNKRVKAESLSRIMEDYPTIARTAIDRHCKEHQTLSGDQIFEVKMSRASKRIQEEKVREMFTHNMLRQGIMDAAGDLLKNGSLKGITASAALKAAKDTSDIEEKQKDRALEMAKMINYFASGELKRTNDGIIAAPPPEGNQRRLQ